MAHHAIPVLLLRPGVCRPGECRLRQAADAAGSGHERLGLRSGSGDLLHRVLPVRGAREHDPAEDRRTPLDRPAHDGLGSRVGLHAVRAGHRQLLRPPIPARDRGVGLLSGRDSLSDVLVHAEAPREDGGRLHERRSGFRHGGGPRLRVDSGHDDRRGTPVRLAVAVSPGGHPLRPRRRCHALLPDRPAIQGALAGRG